MNSEEKSDLLEKVEQLLQEKRALELQIEVLKAAKVLRDSETLFKSIFEKHGAIMLLIEPETGLIIDANESASKFYGYSKQELCSMSINKINLLSSEQVLVERSAALNEKRNYFIFPHQLANGEIRHVEVHSSPIEFSQQRVLFSIIHDITERKRSEEALIESEARLKFVQKTSGAGLWDWDMQTNLLKWSPELFRMFGLNPEEDRASFENWDKALHPDDKEAAYNHINDSVKNRLQLYNEYRVVHPNGEELWINAIGNTIYDDDGNPVRMAGICIDISERKQADKILHEIIEKNPISIQIVDKEGYTLQTNAAHTSLFGAVPPPDYSIFKDQQIVNQGFIELFEGVKAGKSVKFPDFTFNIHEVYPELPDKPIWLRLVIFPLFDNSGKQNRYVLMHEDITERKQAEDALKESEEKHRNLLQNLHAGVVVHAADSSILYANEQASQLLGLSLDQLMGKAAIDPAWQFVNDDLTPMPSNQYPVEYVIANQKPLRQQVLGINRPETNDLVWVMVNAFPEFEINGSLRQVVVTFIDITERINIEKRLRFTQFAIDHSADSAYWMDENARFVYVNEVACKTRGYSKEEFLSMTVPDIDPDYPIHVWAKHMKDLEQSGNMIFETDHRTRDGRVIPVEVNANFVEFNQKKYNCAFVRDISERKRIELLLREKTEEIEVRNEELLKAIETAEESEAKFREMMELLPQIVFESDLQGNLTYVNKHAYKLTGYSEKDDLIGKSTLSFYIPEDKERAIENIKLSLMGNRKAPNNEYTMLRKDGSTFNVLVYSNPILKDDKPVGLRGIIVDVSEIKQTQLALQQAKEYAEQLIQTANVIIVGLNVEGNLIVFNETAEKITGYRKDEMQDKNWLEVLVPKENYSEFWEEFNRLLDGGIPRVFENPILTKAGEERLISWQNSELREGGKVVGTISFGIDITERRRGEEELKISKNRFDLAMVASKDGIFDWNLVSNEIYYSPGWKSMLGYAEDELPNDFSVWETLTEPSDVQRSWKMQQEMINKQRDRFEMEFKMKHKSGHWVDILSRAEAIFDENGKAVRIVGTHVDITERKRTEHLLLEKTEEIEAQNEELNDSNSEYAALNEEYVKQNEELIEAKERAEESDRLKSAFLANMSHEIRTPMNGILGFADLLKEPNLTGEEQQKYIGIIEKSGVRMLNIINDIISISKIEAGLMEVNWQESNINEQIEYIYTFFKPEAEGKGLQLSFRNTLPAKEAILKTDREKVYAILTNLVKNAIKYSKKGSIEVGYIKKAGFLEFYVKDTGIGIPKNRLQAIFERFIQADITDQNAFQGAGLGLAISKAYVEMLGGKIWVESEVETGSTFCFTLPLGVPAFSEHSDGKEEMQLDASVPEKKLKILIAEDDEMSEELISIAVRFVAREIIRVRTGNGAMAACVNNPDIDLILMDIQMPDQNGYEATRQIRMFNPDVIIIAQTAYALEGDREKALAAGCNDYITKPIKAEELKKVILKYFLNKNS
jgi:PAS domain S-box-containing protein